MKRSIKRDISMILIGVLITSLTIVLADTLNSNEVLYDNSSSNTSFDNVQDAIDDLYNIYDHSGLGFSLLTHTPTGLSTSLVAGMYRYQGTTANNYICFGTTNKNDCVSDTDKYMYRIIGITSSGQIKLIKSGTVGNYGWNSFNSLVNWPESEVYKRLNGLDTNNYFIGTDYLSSAWETKILTTIWHYGVLSNVNKNAIEIYNEESNFENTIEAKIGLLYLHDFYYSLAADNNQGYNCVASSNVCKTSWLNSSEQWTMARSDSSSWGINNGLPIDYRQVHYTMQIRPVFFLRASETIASGSGTITDPYILS